MASSMLAAVVDIRDTVHSLQWISEKTCKCGGKERLIIIILPIILIKLTQIQAQHIALCIRMYPIPCVFSSVFISFRVPLRLHPPSVYFPLQECFPPRMCPTPCVSNSVCIPLHVYAISCAPLHVSNSLRVYLTLRLSHSKRIQLSVYPIPCVSHSVSHSDCIAICVSHSVLVNVPLHEYPTPEEPHFYTPLRLYPTLYPTMCIPLRVCCLNPSVSHSVCVPHHVFLSQCESHSVCAPVRVRPVPYFFHHVNLTSGVFHFLCILISHFVVFHSLSLSVSHFVYASLSQTVCVSTSYF